MAVTVTLAVTAGVKMVEFNGYAGNPRLALVEVGLMVVETVTVTLEKGVGELEIGREEMLWLLEGTGEPDVSREVMVRLVEGVGRPELGREMMLELIDKVGNPEVGREVVPFTVGRGGKPELGRIVELRLPLVGNGGKPELGPVTGGRRVVKFEDMIGVKLGTGVEVTFRVGAMVGLVLDEPMMVERESEELTPALDLETLETKVPTLLEPVPRGTGTDVFVMGSGVGITETVVETVTGP